MSFDDLRMVDGVEHGTFMEAAIARELCYSDKIWADTLVDGFNCFRNAGERMRFFALLLYTNRESISDARALFVQSLEMIAPGKRHKNNIVEQTQYALRRCEFILRKNGVNPSPYPRKDGTYESACEFVGLDAPLGVDFKSLNQNNVRCFFRKHFMHWAIPSTLGSRYAR